MGEKLNGGRIAIAVVAVVTGILYLFISSSIHYTFNNIPKHTAASHYYMVRNKANLLDKEWMLNKNLTSVGTTQISNHTGTTLGDGGSTQTELITTTVSTHLSTASTTMLTTTEKSQSIDYLILFWTAFFGHKDYDFGVGQEAFIKHNCTYTNCATTIDRNKYNVSAAIVIHMREGNSRQVPTYRTLSQRWIGFLLESPVHGSFDGFNGLLNWTATYRLDSDVYVPYFQIEKLEKPLMDSVPNNAVYKTKLVAWVVSNCGGQSQRMAYVKTLAKHISVDIFGGCGKRCPGNCFKDLGKEYKFYLSFENSICKDYMTEKVQNALSNNMLPVVMGGANYLSVLPEKSFIDIKQFNSTKQLAEYLQYLNSNDKEYNKFFQWKSTYSVYGAIADGFCDICRALNENKTEHTYQDIRKWWSSGTCTSPSQFYKM